MSNTFHQSVPRRSVSPAAQTSVGAAAGQILAKSFVRRGLLIQNTGTTIIYLLLGTGTPTTSVYHIALKACAVANDGTGGIYNDDVWAGPVQAIGSAPGGTLSIFEIP